MSSNNESLAILEAELNRVKEEIKKETRRIKKQTKINTDYLLYLYEEQDDLKDRINAAYQDEENA